MLKAATPGGSFSPEAWQSLQPLLRSGQLRIMEHVQVDALDWCEGSVDLYYSDELSGDVLRCSRVWLATGSVVDVHQVSAASRAGCKAGKA